eukprot:15953960-Heterocapsa_arctica.AAC.1
MDDMIATVLMAIWRGPGLAFATIVLQKGRGDRHVILALGRWFRESGLNGHVRIRTDSEATIRAVAAD